MFKTLLITPIAILAIIFIAGEGEQNLIPSIDRMIHGGTFIAPENGGSESDAYEVNEADDDDFSQVDWEILQHGY